MPPLPAELPTVHPKPKTTLSIQACDFLVSQQCLATCEPFAIFEAMQVEIPDPALAGLTVTTDEARLSIGLGLYQDGKATLGQTARVAGISVTNFMKELGRRHIPMNYRTDALLQDLKTLEQFPT